MPIKQIKVGFDNFCYVIYCNNRKKSAIVDPGFNSSTILEFISSKNLELKYVINTHYHSDHTSQTQHIKNLYPSIEIIASEDDGNKISSKIDIKVNDNYKLKLWTEPLLPDR